MVNNVNNKIMMGQGEYVVFHELPNKVVKTFSKETYEKAYKVLQEYSPAAIINHEANLKDAEDKCTHRYELMREKSNLLIPL